MPLNQPTLYNTPHVRATRLRLGSDSRNPLLFGTNLHVSDWSMAVLTASLPPSKRDLTTLHLDHRKHSTLPKS